MARYAKRGGRKLTRRAYKKQGLNFNNMAPVGYGNTWGSSWSNWGLGRRSYGVPSYQLGGPAVAGYGSPFRGFFSRLFFGY